MMTRLAMAVFLGQSGHLALAVQSQIPLRVGDCVKATTELEFFYKDEGEYEKTHYVEPGQHGVLLNFESEAQELSNVEFVNAKSREPEVSGAVFFHQFARVPWQQGNLKVEQGGTEKDVCMTVTDSSDKSYQKVVKMTKCEDSADKTDPKVIKRQWRQQFSFSRHECGARPIRWTDDPSKCVDAVHPTKVLLTDCSGADSQKFQFRCDPTTAVEAVPAQGNTPAVPAKGPKCFILGMGGRKDMCLWWDHDLTKDAGGGEADLQIRSCNFDEIAKTKDFRQNAKKLDEKVE